MPSNTEESADRAEANRRAETRVAAELRVEYASVDDLIVAYTEDVSRGGLFMRTTEFLPVGAVVSLALDMPDGGTRLQAIARVAYIVDEKNPDGRAPGMGMEFLDVGGQPLAQQIAEYLALEESDSEDAAPTPAFRILVVDDDDNYRALAVEILKGEGHEIHTAKNGLEGLGKALQLKPDLVLSDVQMPAMDGWQLLRMIRARPNFANTPVVLVTTLRNDEERLRGYRLGVDDYIGKPYERDELAVRIRRVLQRIRGYPRERTNKAMRGDLAQVALPSLLGFLEMERRSGMLLLVNGEQVASMYLRDGAVVRVELPPGVDAPPGLARVMHLLSWNQGQFELAEADVEDEDGDPIPISHALMEHARLSDESSK